MKKDSDCGSTLPNYAIRLNNRCEILHEIHIKCANVVAINVFMF